MGLTEFGRNLLHRVDLADATTPTPLGTTVAYHFTGPAPDSMRADSDGNLYVALYGQGRILTFNRNGIPIGQVLLPGGTKATTCAPPAWRFGPARTSSSSSRTTARWAGLHDFSGQGLREGAAAFLASLMPSPEHMTETATMATNETVPPSGHSTIGDGP